MRSLVLPSIAAWFNWFLSRCDSHRKPHLVDGAGPAEIVAPEVSLGSRKELSPEIFYFLVRKHVQTIRTDTHTPDIDSLHVWNETL